MGRRLLWRPDTGVEVLEAPFEVLDSEEFRNSPVLRIYSTGVPMRYRLAEPSCPLDFALLRELRAEGVSDYFAVPLRFTNGEIHTATWTTRQPGGWSAAHLETLLAIGPPLARLAEVYALRRTAGNLLDAYVGHNTGERILAGRIRLGDTEAIQAAIWLSDMRGFTRRADHLPAQSLIQLLNRYFGCQVPAILDHGGEVLKFMGDGLLAIFPFPRDGTDARRICARALAAALEARAAIAALPSLPGVEGDAPLQFGLALHCGEVLYGNIGGGNRLDFTCIGPAVNLAARLEALAGRLGRSIVASREFANSCGGGLAPIGQFNLPGFAAAASVFGLAGEVPAS